MQTLEQQDRRMAVVRLRLQGIRVYKEKNTSGDVRALALGIWERVVGGGLAKPPRGLSKFKKGNNRIGY